MALNFDRIKTIDKSVQYSVYGYVRSCQKLFPSNNAYYDIHGHSIIVSCILLFFDEPEVFEINGKSSFRYTAPKQSDNELFHVFGQKVVERKYTKTYKWVIETDDNFFGTFGIIDTKFVETVKNGAGKYLWYSHVEHMAVVGSENGGFNGAIFNGENTYAFVSGKGDIVTIELDYANDKVTFSSKNKDKTKSDALKKGVDAVRFVAEFRCHDTEIGFKSV